MRSYLLQLERRTGRITQSVSEQESLNTSPSIVGGNRRDWFYVWVHLWIFICSELGPYACVLKPLKHIIYLKEIFGIKHLETARFEWEIGKWYKLQIEAKGNQFKYYIDGKLVINYTDGSHSTGKIGIWGGVHSTTYHYDDFTVTGGQVSDLNLSVSPQSRLATVWAQV